jgi:hypothetical protein
MMNKVTRVNPAYAKPSRALTRTGSPIRRYEFSYLGYLIAENVYGRFDVFLPGRKKVNDYDFQQVQEAERFVEERIYKLRKEKSWKS